MFGVLRRHLLRLNASKCAFGVGSRKFLGYMITYRGIAVNLDQITTIKCLRPPRNPKEVQRLTRMVTALNRFISKSVERYKPFFQLLKKWNDYVWTLECEEAFQRLKEYLTKAPILSRPESGENLYMYLSMSNHAVSVVLVRIEIDSQKPVNYVSKTLLEAEVRYLPLEKIALALVHATRWLLHYSQAHTVIVLIE